MTRAKYVAARCFWLSPFSRAYSSGAATWTHTPVFQVDPNTVHILGSPTAFYAALLEGIHSAKRRIALTSLYIGPDQEPLRMALESALSRQPHLRVYFLLDYLRSTRPEKGASAHTSTVQLFSSLINAYPNQVSFSLYHTPLLKGMTKKWCPNRFNEAFGLMHMKSYIFDDQLIMSGANLNRNYFVNRQDRYYQFQHHPELAHFYFDLSQTVASFSSHVKPSSPSLSLLDPPPRSAHVHALNQFYDRWLTHPNCSLTRMPCYVLDEKKKSTVVAIPLIQMGLYGIRQEETFLSQLLQRVGHFGHYSLSLASAYLNFPNKYISNLFTSQLQSPRPTRLDVLTAAPQANGFYGSRGISGHLPAAYTYLETLFLRQIRRISPALLDTLRIFEYHREKWTFHVKGVWLKRNNESDPFLTVIGSSNLGRRSMERDLEAQLVIVSQDPHLNQCMGQEISALKSVSNQVQKDTFAHPQRKVRLWIKLVTRMIRSML